MEKLNNQTDFEINQNDKAEYTTAEKMKSLQDCLLCINSVRRVFRYQFWSDKTMHALKIQLEKSIMALQEEHEKNYKLERLHEGVNKLADAMNAINSAADFINNTEMADNFLSALDATTNRMSAQLAELNGTKAPSVETVSKGEAHKIPEKRYIINDKDEYALDDLQSTALLPSLRLIREKHIRNMTRFPPEENEKYHANDELLDAAIFTLTGDQKCYPKSWSNTYRKKANEEPDDVESWINAAALICAAIDRELRIRNNIANNVSNV